MPTSSPGAIVRSTPARVPYARPRTSSAPAAGASAVAGPATSASAAGASAASAKAVPGGPAAAEAEPRAGEPTAHGASRAVARRAELARAWARTSIVSANRPSGPRRNWVSAERRHQLADRDLPVEGLAAADPGDGDQEPAGHGEGDAGVGRPQPVGVERPAERGGAGPAVAVGRRPGGAEALEHPQPAEQVGGHAGRGTHGLLLGVGPGHQRSGQRLDGEHHDRHADDHREPDGHRRGQQDPGADHRAGRGAGAEHHSAHALADAGGLDGRQADQLAGQGILHATAGRQHPLGQPDPRPVGGPHHRQLLDVERHAPRRRQHHEQGHEDERPARHRRPVAGHDRPVDDHADHHRDGGLEGLVGGDQPRAQPDRPALRPDRVPQHRCRLRQPVPLLITARHVFGDRPCKPVFATCLDNNLS